MKLNKLQYWVIVTLSFIISFSSCSEDTKNVLTGGTFRYWHYIDSKNNKANPKHYYWCRADSLFIYLDKNNTYIEFNGRHTFFEHSTIDLGYVYKPTWELLDKNKIRLGRYRYEIFFVSEKRILLFNEGDKSSVDTLELVPIDQVPKEYQDFQKPFQFKERKRWNSRPHFTL